MSITIDPPNMRALRAQFTELTDSAIKGAAASAMNRTLRKTRNAAAAALGARKAISAPKLRKRTRIGRARVRRLWSHFTGLVGRFPYDKIGRGRAGRGGHRVGRFIVPRAWYAPGVAKIVQRKGEARYPTQRAGIDLMPDAREIMGRELRAHMRRDYPELTRVEAEKRARRVAEKWKRRL